MNDDAVSELTRLRAKYPSVIIQGRSRKVDGELVVQYWLKGEGVRCRLVKPRKTKYVSVYEFEVVLQQAIAGTLVAKTAKSMPSAGAKDLSPMQYGKGLIAMLGGYTKWAGSKYIAVALPEQDEYLLPSWRGWLRFVDWTGENPRQRSWSESQRYVLHASGQYAWVVAIDRDAGQAKLIYSGGAKIYYDGTWFSLKPEELQRALITVSKHADEHKWRDKELVGLDMTKACGFDDPVEKKSKKRKEYRKERKARIEVTRVPDNEEEFNDPLTPDGWSGDLGKRYQDE